MTNEQGPLPILLVVLDGLADRPYPALDGLTPLEAASTPVMDQLVQEGQAGFHYPLGPGRVPSTELVHFRFFGYGEHPFPGRACLEALGYDIPCAVGDTFSFLALRRVTREADGSFRVAGGYGEDFEDASAGYAELDGWEDEQTGYRFEVFTLPGSEAILRIGGSGVTLPPNGEVTDSDPFFFTDLPVLRPKPLSTATRPEAARLTAGALDRFLVRAAEVFRVRPMAAQGEISKGAASDIQRLAVSKWTGTLGDLPAFPDLTGVAGASVASTRLMRGLARAFGLRFILHPAPGPSSEPGGEQADWERPSGDLAGKVKLALALLRSGEVRFAHVHAKEADEASHAGDPEAKVGVVEGLDRGLEALLDVPPDRLVLCITSDHCTPVGGRTVHWGDSVPLLVRGPYVRVDGISSFGERSVVRGSLGQIDAAALLPYLLCQADQAHFLGARPLPETPLGVSSRGEPWLYHDLSGTEASQDV